MSDFKTIARGTAVIMFFAILSKILGFVREMSLAYVFGASGTTDAYLVAITIPNILFSIVGGALAVIAVPLFASYVAEGKKEEAWQVFNTVITLLGLIMLGLILVGTPLAKQITWLIAPGLKPATSQLASGLLIIMLPGILFFSLANLFYGLLNANNVFGPPAFGPIVLNVFIIGGTIAGLKYGITVVAVGTLLGYLALMLFQIPFLIKTGFRFKWNLNFREPGVIKAFNLMFPLMIGTGISQIYLVIDRILASGLSEGSISALNYASKLMLLPQGIIVMALGTAIFPILSNRAAAGAFDDYNRGIYRALKMILLLALPAGVGLAVLRFPVVEFLFARGAFDVRATTMTAFAVLCFSIGLVGQCLNPILIRGFYSLQDTVTTVKISVATILLNLAFSLLLIHPLRHGGLALANSIAATFNVVVLFWFLIRKDTGLSFGAIKNFLFGIVIAALVMGLVLEGSDAVLALFLQHGTLALAVRLFLDFLAGAAVFAVACWFLKLDEFLYLANLGITMFKRGFKLLNRVQAGTHE
jgi:putative peptidoglycan lipid II flippase